MDGPEGEREVELTLEEDGRYKVSYPVAAIRADQDVTLRLFDADGGQMALLDSRGERLEGDAATYGVYRYFESALADGSPLTDEDKAKVRATYTYCAYAIRWRHGTELPAGINDLPDATADSESVLAHKATQAGEAPDGVKVTAITLLLQSNTSLRLYFDCEGPAPEVTLDGLAVEPVWLYGQKHYVETLPIGVAHLRDRHTVSFDGGAYVVELDALSYVYSALRDQGSSEDLKNVSKALWAYSEAFA